MIWMRDDLVYQQRDKGGVNTESTRIS